MKRLLSALLLCASPALAQANGWQEIQNGWGEIQTATGGAGTPGGADTQVQINDGGAFYGNAGLTYQKASNALSGTGPWTLTPGADLVPFTARAYSSGTNHIAQFQDSSNNFLAGITHTGGFLSSTLTSGRVPIIGTSGLITDDSGLTYDAATDVLTSGTFIGKVPGVGGTLKVCASNAKVTTGCDYLATGTADNVTIQTAIDALPPGGGSIVLSDGTFTWSATGSVKVKDKTSIRGQGYATLLTVTGTPSSLKMFDLSSDRYTRQHITFSDFRIDAAAKSVTPFYLGYYTNSEIVSDVRFSRLNVSNFTGTNYGIIAIGAEDIHVSDCVFDLLGAGDSAIEFRNVGKSTIVGNTFRGKGTLQFYAGNNGGSTTAPNGVSVVGNTFTDSYLVTDDGTPLLQNYSIVGNAFYGAQSTFLTLRSMVGAVIVGNAFDNSTLSTSTPTVILTSTVSSYLLSDNSFYSGKDTANGFTHGTIQTAGSNGLIRGNVIRQLGAQAAATLGAIWVTTGAVNNAIVGNSITGEAGNLTNVAGIYLGAGDGTFLAENHVNTLALGVNIAAGVTGTRIDGPIWTATVGTVLTDAGTGTKLSGVSPLLPTYADNAAAITGGLAAGDPYRTATGVLMVTYTP